MTGVDSINPAGDSRVSHHYANLNDKNYHYLLGVPTGGSCKATIFLLHGWPDLSMGWRYQIPMLLELSFRVVCPDLMGFGETDAPQVPPESPALYSHKRAADDMKELARQLGAKKIFVGGHDWGGSVAYRLALWYPQLVTHLISVCTPYSKPAQHFVTLEEYIKVTNFGYQLKLAGGQIDGITSKQQIKQFLNAAYGGQGQDGTPGFSIQHGLNFENLSHLQPTKLVSDAVLDYYADQYSRNGLRGTTMWYRMREQNFQDERLLERTTIDIPVLFIQATNDPALPLRMSAGMGKYIPNLTMKRVETEHWALWQKPANVNQFIKEWLQEHNSQSSRSSL